MTRVVVIGVGNAWRRDDSAGLEVARRVRERAPAGVTVLETEPTGIAGELAGVDAAFFADAVSSGMAPGTVHRLDAAADGLPRGALRASTHSVGVAEALELARALGTLPARVVVFGVEGRDFSAGEGLSPEVERGVAEAVEAVLREALEAAGRA